MRLHQLLILLLTTGLFATELAAKPDNKHKAKPLPPGLQKQVARGKPLPPGWHKKVIVGQKLDSDIYARGRIVAPLGRDGTLTLDVEGSLFKLKGDSRVVLEISH